MKEIIYVPEYPTLRGTVGYIDCAQGEYTMHGFSVLMLTR